jgi:putative transposase
MPRRPRVTTEHLVFHVFNRAVQRTTLFDAPDDYDAFLRIIVEALQRLPMQVLAYVLMPNHWHLVLWPAAGQSLSAFMKWLTATHVLRWRTATHTRGRGALYQGRFKAVAVQSDDHFLRLVQYVERNPVRKRLVAEAKDWRWSSAWNGDGIDRPELSPWPVTRPADWLVLLNLPQAPADLVEIRTAIRGGMPYGSTDWREQTARSLGWPTGLRQPGRPRRQDYTSVTEMASES